MAASADNSRSELNGSILTAKYFFFVVGLFSLFIMGFSNIAYGATVLFDSPQYYSDHSFILTVREDTGLQNYPNTVSVSVISSADNHAYTLTRVSTSSTYTSSPITFTTGQAGSTQLKITSLTGQETITATYNPISPPPPPGPQTSTAAANVTSSDEGTLPPNPLVPPPLWTKRQTSCGTTTGSLGGDADRDGICDAWEDQTKHNGLVVKYSGTPSAIPPNGYWILPCVGGPTTRHDGNPFARIDTQCPGTDQADLYVEVDWMKGHKPTQAAIDNVVAAFANSPYKSCPTCKAGVRLHVILDQEIPIHKDTITTPIAGGAGGTDYDAIKQAYFGTLDDLNSLDPTWSYNWNLTARKQVFHYAEFIHSQSDAPGSSGTSEMPGNDFVVSLGNWFDSIGSQDQQEGTFMHELGHNMGLDHGGNTHDNCKPNYLSVMSYSRQFAESYNIHRDLDYSGDVLTTLDKSGNTLVEPDGVGTPSKVNQMTVFGYQLANGTLIPVTSPAGLNIEWDNTTPIEPRTNPVSNPNIDILTKVGCSPPTPPTPPTTSLFGYNDWSSSLNFTSRNYISWNDGERICDAVTGLCNENVELHRKGQPQPAMTEENSQNKIRFAADDGTQVKEKTNLHKGNVLKHIPKISDKRKYRLPGEITYDIVQDIRSSRINALKFHISQQYPSGKLGVETKELFADIDKVNDLTMQNDFNNAISTLIKTKEKVQKLDISSEGKKAILSEIDSNAQLLKIASTTSQPEKEKIVIEPKEKISVAPKESFETTNKTKTIK